LSTFVDASLDDVAAVRLLLGREPAGRFAVVVRRSDGRPVVIENEPHLRDGTPMPTLYWLVDREIAEQVSRIEAAGGVRRIEQVVAPVDLAAAHVRHAERRRHRIIHPELVEPAGGVGGTRRGVKCLHAHLANFLATGDDPVGSVVSDELVLPELVREAT
jgi:hypothetical protein